MQSPIYWHPFLYRSAMKLSYGKQYALRYERLAEYIPDSARVFELCMGDAHFYQHYLQPKKVVYACGDVNPLAVKAAVSKGIDARLMNVFTDEIPQTDYMLMHASLSYFIPQEASVILKLMAAAKQKVIIAESVNNLSNAASGLKSSIGTFLSQAKAGQSKVKFTRETLKKSFEPFADHIETWDESPERREVIIVLKP